MKRLPPHVYFGVSAVFHYLGPSFAVLLFARVDVLGVAWLRIASAALLFALWRRPWRAFAQLDRAGRRLVLAWGCVLALMNCCFYAAISRQPLGSVAAIEFVPVIALAAIGLRSRRNLAALALAVPGVYLLTGVQWAVEQLGVYSCHRQVIPLTMAGERWSSTTAPIALGASAASGRARSDSCTRACSTRRAR